MKIQVNVMEIEVVLMDRKGEIATKTVRALQDEEGMYYIPVGVFTDTQAFSLSHVEKHTQDIHYAEPEPDVKFASPRFLQ